MQEVAILLVKDDLGRNVYMTKPASYAQFSDVICKVGLFLSVVIIPNGE